MHQDDFEEEGEDHDYTEIKFETLDELQKNISLLFYPCYYYPFCFGVVCIRWRDCCNFSFFSLGARRLWPTVIGST